MNLEMGVRWVFPKRIVSVVMVYLRLAVVHHLCVAIRIKVPAHVFLQSKTQWAARAHHGAYHHQAAGEEIVILCF